VEGKKIPKRRSGLNTERRKMEEKRNPDVVVLPPIATQQKRTLPYIIGELPKIKTTPTRENPQGETKTRKQ